MYLKHDIDDELQCCRSCNNWLRDFNDADNGICSVREALHGYEQARTHITQGCDDFVS